MSSQDILKTDLPSSEAPLPSSPTPVKTQNELQAEKEDQANASKDIHSTAASMNENDKIPNADIKSTDKASPTKDSQHTTTIKTPSLSKSQLDLITKRKTLESQLKALQAEKSLLVSKSTLPSGLPMPEDWTPDQKSKAALETAQGRIKEHIALLHSYNEIKDIGLGLLGMLAEGRGVRVKDLMGEFEMGEKD